MNKDSEDFRELDLLCGNLQFQIVENAKRIKMLEDECSSLRDQIRYLEKNMYND